MSDQAQATSWWQRRENWTVAIVTALIAFVGPYACNHISPDYSLDATCRENIVGYPASLLEVLSTTNRYAGIQKISNLVPHDMGGKDIRGEVVNAVDTVLGLGFVGRFVDRYKFMYDLDIVNDGKKAVENVRLFCPDGSYAEFKNGDDSVVYIADKTTITLGSLQPNDRLLVRVWTPYSRTDSDFRISHTNGSESPSILEPLTPTAALIGKAFTTLNGFSFLCVIASLVFLMIQTFNLFRSHSQRKRSMEKLEDTLKGIE